MGSRSLSRKQKDVPFHAFLKETGKCDIGEVGLDHEESQYLREFFISRYKIRAYVSWGVAEKGKSYETLFSLLYFSPRLFFCANKGNDAVACLYLD